MLGLVWRAFAFARSHRGGGNMINGVTAKLGLSEQETTELCHDFAMCAASWHKRLDVDSRACYLCTAEIEQTVYIYSASKYLPTGIKRLCHL